MVKAKQGGGVDDGFSFSKVRDHLFIAAILSEIITVTSTLGA